MKSIVERLLRTGSANSTRSNASNKKFVWKQTPDGKWFKIGNSLQAANLEGMSENPLYTPEDMSENPLYTPEDMETPNSFVCGVCSTAMHFQLLDEFDKGLRCSICDALCLYNTVQLVCDNCELYVCCKNDNCYDFDKQGWFRRVSCYNSYYDQVEAVRQEFYNQPEILSQFSKTEQQHWLQCMWHDIDQNMNRFRAELHHATQVETIDTTNTSLVVENLGLEMTKSLVRLFVIFQSKFDTDIVEWFLSLLQHQRELFGVIALQTSVKLNGRLEQLKWLVQELSLNVTNYYSSGALKIAAKMGKLDILGYFLEDVRADPSAGDNVAIRTACRNGHLSFVERLLLDDRVDPSAADNDAIRKAIGNDHLSIVQRLLQDDRVDPSAGDNDAIQTASWNGHLGIVELLLQDDRVDPSANDNDAILKASSCGHLNVLERLLQDDRVDPSANDNFAIRKASRKGHLSVVERLLQDCRVDPSTDDNGAIKGASRNGHLGVVERLLQDDRVEPSADDNCAIREASRHGHVRVVERLLQDDRVDPSADDNYAIREASYFGHLTVVERLLQDDRIDPSADDQYAIQMASSNGHLDVVERLLQDDRVDPAAIDNCAIRAASRNGHLNVMERLLQDDRVDPSANDNFAIREASRPVVWWKPVEKFNVVKRLLQDSRVDPAARSCEAMRTANDDKIIKCLYDRTRSIVCFMIDDEELMKKLSPLHSESLVMGGLCLNQVKVGITSTTTLPQEVIFMILLEWASLSIIEVCMYSLWPVN